MTIGLIAGGGEIPQLIAEEKTASGQDVFIVGIRGFHGDWIKDYPHVICGVAELGKQAKALKTANCESVAMIGYVSRPDFTSIKPDFKAISLLPKVIKAAAQGDDALLRVLIEFFEKEGLFVVGAQDLMQDLKCSAGIYSMRAPDNTDRADIEKAFLVAGEIGRLDIGQGAVVARGLVLAVEAQEGTDQMLKRVATLPENIRGSEDKRRGVIVKRPKPVQELRVDLPTVGPATIREAAYAGLTTIAVVEDQALVAGRQKIIDLCDQFGMSFVVLDAEGRCDE